jgi:hypothetical protein
MSKCSTYIVSKIYSYIFTVHCKDDAPHNRVQWMPILKILKEAKKRLTNWSPSVGFPILGGFPTARCVLRDMAMMFFNPDPAQRLRLVPIKGMS